MGVRKWLEKSAEKQKYKLRKTLNPLSRKAFQGVSFSATKDTSEQAMYRLLRLFLKVRARSRRCSSFPNRNRLRWVAIWVRRCAAFFSYRKEISILTALPCRSKADFAPTSFYAWEKDVISARFPVPPLQCGPHPNISGSSRIRQWCKGKSSQFLRKELRSILGNSTT